MNAIAQRFTKAVLDAAAGISPVSGFHSLSEEDYKLLNAVADYMTNVSGSGAFRGEQGGI